MKTATSHSRQPAVAGQFYPAQPTELEQSLDVCFAQTTVMVDKPVRALICPHAGYVFSGHVAATAFAQLNQRYKRVFLLGASHRRSYKGVSLFYQGDFNMPYGTVPVDKTVGKTLEAQHPHLFTTDPTLQLQEHSLEVLLPFLHRTLGDQIPIVPLLIGSTEPDDCKQLADALKPWFTSDNLFIVSTDFSHYPTGKAAIRLDRETMEAIISNQPRALEKVLGAFPQPSVPGLATRLCGWRAVLTLMYLTTHEDLTYHPLTYAHSGENPQYGETNRVVGYWAIAVTEKAAETETKAAETKTTAAETNVDVVKEANFAPSFSLTATAKANLLKLSRETLKAAVKGRPLPTIDPTSLPDCVKANVGAFVTLHQLSRLRGCIGQLTANRPLYKTIIDMTVSAALHDGRFTPVSPEELATIDIELSILSPLEPIEKATDIVLGYHGILIEKGRHRGVFLPQVATETGWDLETFLGHCSRDKAGLDWDGWKNATVYRFTATIFGERDNRLV